MYFRFPVLLLIILAVSFGLVYLGIKFQNEVPAATSEPAHNYHDKATSSSPALESIRAGELRAHLHFLADDLLEGRDTGSRGARLAALYIANQFERLGLEPVADKETYFQEVRLSQRTVSPNPELSIEIDGEMVPLRYGTDFLIARLPETDIELTAELVFTGFGIRAPEYNYDDFKNVDVEDKVTVYLSGEPTSDDESYFNGEESSPYSNDWVKRNVARSLKAWAAIAIAQPELLEQTDWSLFRRHYTRTRTALYEKEVSSTRTPFPAVMLHPDVGDLVFSGSGMDFEEVRKAAQAGELKSFQMNRKVQVKFQVEEKELEDRNVVGLLEGSDPVLKSEVLVYTAHYDHVGIGVAVQGDSIYNGAADNASGVAGLLELAEAFSLLPQAPKRSILFLAVTAEEKGLLGSQYYLNHPIFPISKTVANFNFDMIGLGDTTGMVVYGIERSTLGTVIKSAAEEMQLKILPDELPEQRIFYRSDHYSFAQKGVPAIFPAFGLHRESFADFEAYYHQPTDDVNLPFNYDYMKKHVQVLFLAGLKVANSNETPSWAHGDEFEKIGVDSPE